MRSLILTESVIWDVKEKNDQLIQNVRVSLNVRCYRDDYEKILKKSSRENRLKNKLLVSDKSSGSSFYSHSSFLRRYRRASTVYEYFAYWDGKNGRRSKINEHIDRLLVQNYKVQWKNIRGIYLCKDTVRVGQSCFVRKKIQKYHSKPTVRFKMLTTLLVTLISNSFRT